MRIVVRALALSLALAPFAAPAQDSVFPGGILGSGSRFRLRAELKANYRDSAFDSLTVGGTGLPFAVVLSTPSADRSIELSNVALTVESDLTTGIFAKAVVHIGDLYNRNPTSSDDRIALREAFVRFGKKLESLQSQKQNGGLYVQAGKFPRFTKQIVRRMESYGLWGTAVGRLEEVGLEAGGTLGSVFYFRAAAGNGNPVFLRDVNALAGDNGTPERQVGSTTAPVYGSGFPILYDTKSNDVSFSGRFQYGGGLGMRFNFGDRDRDGIDILGWYYTRKMEACSRIRGTSYCGDLGILDAFTKRLPFEGDKKKEWGVNADMRFGPVHFYAQYVKQEIANLPRKGYEAEASYRLPLNGLFASGDTSLFNWIEPVVRYSKIDNDFANTPGYPAPSVTWDWTKLDYGVRIGVMRGVDVTVEWTKQDAKAAARTLHPDEFLTTLRASF
ncbi:MAG: hypothetical protein JNK60_09415 [Acidobacteria bacterium]|nr:hypothetical protein [Acidobacteriota bacterium]